MTLDEALSGNGGNDVVTIACFVVVLWANDDIVLTASDEAFFEAVQRIPVRDAEWMLEGMSALSPYAGGPARYFEPCAITGILRRRDGVAVFTDVSRCVVCRETLDDFGNEGLFELVLDRTR